MKIGFDAKRAFFNPTGLGNYSRNLLHAFSKYYPDNQYYLYSPQLPKTKAMQFIERPEHFHISLPESGWQQAMSGYWRTFSLAKRLQKDRLDIYHGLSHELPFGIHKSAIKKVVTIHDLIFLRYPEWYPYIDREIYKRKFQYACKTADVIIAISEQTKRDIIHYFHIPDDKIKVIYQSCDPRFYEPAPEANIAAVQSKYSLPERYILYVGALTPRKNVLQLVKAFNQVSKAHPDVHLVLVGGESSYGRKIEAYIQGHHLQGKVHRLSSVISDELPSIYQCAEIFIYPSVYEGFGIPIVEALWSKVPVITSSGSCFPEAGGKGAVYADPASMNELIDKMNQLLSNHAEREMLVKEGFAHVQQFHEKQFAQQVMQVYEQLLS